jgi:hypothetical protein
VIQAQAVAYQRAVIERFIEASGDLPEDHPLRGLKAEIHALSAEFNRVSRRRDGFDRRDLVDNFLAYLTELSSEILRAHPEALRSGRTVTLEKVLRFFSLQDFIAAEVERRIHELSFGGFGDLKAAFDKDFKLPITSSPEEHQAMERAILMRNLITHHRGRVGERFIRDWEAAGGGQGEFEVGARLTRGDIVQGIDPRLIVRLVLDLDTAAVEKYGLEVHPIESQLPSYTLDFDEVFGRAAQGE